MSRKIGLSKNVVITIIVILLLSLIVNIAMAIDVSKYRYKIGTEAYNHIEEVRSLHESNMQILSKAIDSESIDNMAILKLYKNYSDLTADTAHLWNEYIYYEEHRRGIISKKNIDTSNVTVNDVNSKIADFLNDLLEVEMQNQNYKIDLTGNIADSFKIIYNFESDNNDYYANFSKNQLNGAVQEKKKNKIIKQHYWIDILEGYNDINSKYLDYEFKI